MKIDVTKLPVGEALVGFVLAAVAVTFVLAFVIGPKGGVGEGEAGAEQESGSEATTSDGGAAGGGAEGNIATSMGDNFFDSNEVSVAAGAVVTFDLVNEGIAIHNMRIAGSDGEYNTEDDTISDPELFTPGDTGTLEWTAPDQAGEIIFRCDFHPIDMIGTITVG
jgi:plastocyanin